MGTTADKLNAVLASKNSIKNAIVAKGVAVPDNTPLSQYASKINSITTCLNPYAPLSTDLWSQTGFDAYGASVLSDYPIDWLNPSRLTMQTDSSHLCEMKILVNISDADSNIMNVIMYSQPGSTHYIDWGDGTILNQIVPAESIGWKMYNHIYNYNDNLHLLSNGTTKQAQIYCKIDMTNGPGLNGIGLSMTDNENNHTISTTVQPVYFDFSGTNSVVNNINYFIELIDVKYFFYSNYKLDHYDIGFADSMPNVDYVDIKIHLNINNLNTGDALTANFPFQNSRFINMVITNLDQIMIEKPIHVNVTFNCKMALYTPDFSNFRSLSFNMDQCTNLKYAKISSDSCLASFVVQKCYNLDYVVGFDLSNLTYLSLSYNNSKYIDLSTLNCTNLTEFQLEYNTYVKSFNKITFDFSNSMFSDFNYKFRNIRNVADNIIIKLNPSVEYSFQDAFSNSSFKNIHFENTGVKFSGMEQAFSGCYTSNITTTTGEFEINCSNTHCITGMYSYCSARYVPGLKLNNGVNIVLDHLCYGSKLTENPNIILNNTTLLSAFNIFGGCIFNKMNLFDTSTLKESNFMFSQLTYNGYLPNFNFDSVTSAQNMFEDSVLYGLTSLNLPSVTNISDLFMWSTISYMPETISLNSNMTSYSNFYKYALANKSIPNFINTPSGFNLENNIYITNAEYLKYNYIANHSFTIHVPYISYKELNRIFTRLPVVTKGQTINISSVTSEGKNLCDITIATNKGWTIIK